MAQKMILFGVFGPKLSAKELANPEGCEPPILNVYFDRARRLVGVYRRDTLHQPALTWGPMFKPDGTR